MLTDLSIKNFAIIDSLHLNFGRGLTILTGETGAGKSIIIDAVNLLLGERASVDLIRSGEEEAVVEAIFDISGLPEVQRRLDEAGLEPGDELLVKRIVAHSGRNRVYLNGGLSTLAILAEIMRDLVNIYGQHEAQTLLRPDNHLELLDGFAGLAHVRKGYSSCYDEYRRTLAEIHRLDEGERSIEKTRDMLQYQADEIGAALLTVDEDRELTAQREMLLHAEKLFESSRGAYELLYDGEPSVAGLLAQSISLVRDIAHIDPAMKELAESLEASRIQVEDVSLSLRSYAERIESDPERLNEVQDRLDLIGRLKKKYGASIEEILDRKVEADEELLRIGNREENRSVLEQHLVELERKLVTTGKELSVARTQSAAALKEAMERELHALAMTHALFTVEFKELAELGPAGLERAEFLFSPNPGETPKPLARIASGGELSRLMLALKQIHPESDVPSLVFDEVDTGIGGATASIVGEKLANVAQRQQVLCITHMPQVAAYADTHFKVAKQVENGRTVTTVVSLNQEQRVQEMARMLGGVKITDKTLDHAREMIQHATGV